MKATVYAYGLDKNQWDKLYHLCQSFGYDAILWEKDALNKPLGSLLGLEGFEMKEKEVNKKLLDDDHAFLYFDHLPKEKNDFLLSLKEKVAYFPYKANRTETNIHWSLGELLAYNQEEHEVMTIYGHLRRAAFLAEEILSKEDIPSLQEALTEAKEYLTPKDFDPSKLKQVYTQLGTQVNRILSKRKKEV